MTSSSETPVLAPLLISLGVLLLLLFAGLAYRLVRHSRKISARPQRSASAVSDKSSAAAASAAPSPSHNHRTRTPSSFSSSSGSSHHQHQRAESPEMIAKPTASAAAGELLDKPSTADAAKLESGEYLHHARV